MKKKLKSLRNNPHKVDTMIVKYAIIVFLLGLALAVTEMIVTYSTI